MWDLKWRKERIKKARKDGRGTWRRWKAKAEGWGYQPWSMRWCRKEQHGWAAADVQWGILELGGRKAVLGARLGGWSWEVTLTLKTLFSLLLFLWGACVHLQLLRAFLPLTAKVLVSFRSWNHCSCSEEQPALSVSATAFWLASFSCICGGQWLLSLKEPLRCTGPSNKAAGSGDATLSISRFPSVQTHRWRSAAHSLGLKGLMCWGVANSLKASQRKRLFKRKLSGWQEPREDDPMLSLLLCYPRCSVIYKCIYWTAHNDAITY